LKGADNPILIEQELKVMPYGMMYSEESPGASTVRTTASGVDEKQKLKLAVAEVPPVKAIKPSSNSASVRFDLLKLDLTI